MTQVSTVTSKLAEERTGYRSRIMCQKPKERRQPPPEVTVIADAGGTAQKHRLPRSFGM